MPVTFKVVLKGLVGFWWFQANGGLSFVMPRGHGAMNQLVHTPTTKDGLSWEPKRKQTKQTALLNLLAYLSYLSWVLNK